MSKEETDETELVRRAQCDDRQAFDELYTLHQAWAMGVATKFFHNPQTARDAVQDAFLQVFKGIKQFEGRCQFRTWLTTIVRNCCLKEAQKQSDRDQVEPL